MKSNVYNWSYQEKQAIYSHFRSFRMHETEILCITHKHPREKLLLGYDGGSMP